MTTARVQAALDTRCGMCGAEPGQPCHNTLQPGEPLPGRRVHFYRMTTTRGEAT